MSKPVKYLIPKVSLLWCESETFPKGSSFECLLHNWRAMVWVTVKP